MVAALPRPRENGLSDDADATTAAIAASGAITGAAATSAAAHLPEPDDDAPFAVTLPPRPYPGLRPFDEAEWPIFFGRERMVDAVVSRLITSQFIAVHGDSGSGKSSLIRAGVLPRLRQEQTRGGARWRTCIAMPRGGPMRNLSRALAALDGRADDAEHVLALRRALNQGRRAPAALAELLLRGEHDHLCLLVDQFEELFEFARQPQGAGEARLLTDALVAMAEQPPCGLYLALTMRSEFLGACARFPGFAEAVNVHQYLLPPMGPGDLLRAIREPAPLYGGEVEAALAERLAADAAGVDGLPLVQHALMLLHREHGAGETWRLTAAHYPADGLGALLSRHADNVATQALAALPVALPGRDRVVEDLFRTLTAITAEGHAVRRPQTLGQAAAVAGTEVDVLARVVDCFRADGVSFLTPRADGRPLVADDWIDIGHEALIRGWTALAELRDGWLVREFRNGLVWRSLLVQADSFERDPGNVLSDATTEERQRWMERRTPVWAERYGGGWERVQALIDASAKARDERRAEREEAQADALRLRRLKGVAWATLALLTVSTVAVTVFWQLNREAVRQRQEAEQAKALAELSNNETKRLLDGNRKTVDYLQATLNELESARQSGSAAALRSAVETITNQLTGAASGLQQAAADLAPRVYVHIGDESQRAAAEGFRRQFAQVKLGTSAVVLPGVQLVEKQANNGVLRCFRVDECRDEAPQLLRLANGLLASPTLQLQDLSRQYGDSTTLRPHHFEIWFGHETVRLVEAAGASKN